MTDAIEMVTSASALRDVFRALDGVIDRRNNLPIFKSVHITGDNSDLRVTIMPVRV